MNPVYSDNNEMMFSVIIIVLQNLVQGRNIQAVSPDIYANCILWSDYVIFE